MPSTPVRGPAFSDAPAAIPDISTPPIRTLTVREVCAKVKCSRGFVYAHGDFPKPLKLGLKKSLWVEAEIDAWLETLRVARDRAA